MTRTDRWTKDKHDEKTFRYPTWRRGRFRIVQRERFIFDCEFDSPSLAHPMFSREFTLAEAKDMCACYARSVGW